MKTTVRQLLDGGPTISVGMLTADLLRLGDELAVLEQAGANVVHVDVMDGVFCPQFTVGPPIVKAIPDSFIKDCHLMIDEPLTKVQSFVDAGARHHHLSRRVDQPPAPGAPVAGRQRRDPWHRA